MLCCANTKSLALKAMKCNIFACRVGTGVNDVERKTIDERMKGNLVDQKGPPAKYVAPRCYKVTGAKKERPDVWVKDPTRSIVLQVRLLMTASAQILSVYTVRHTTPFMSQIFLL